MNELPKARKVGQGKTRQELIAEIAEEFPNAMNRALARIAMERWPQVFGTVERARTAVRTLRGANGATHLKYVGNKSFVRPIGWQVNAVPVSRSKKREPVTINGPVRLGVFGDVHIPYHSPEAVEVMVKFFKTQKVGAILINGDLCDFYSCSRHEKDPRRPLKEELDAARQFLFWLRAQFPKIPIHYKVGNHETNLERYLMRQAPVLLGVPEFELRDVMKLDEMNIQLIESLQLIQAGRLSIFHGHELPQGMSSPVNPARGIWMRVQETMLCNHWHRTSEHAETTGVTKKVTSCWSLGCLCDLAPDYALVNKWNHGFAIVDVLDKSGNFEVRNHKIVGGKVY